jgi:hypothetical protein
MDAAKYFERIGFTAPSTITPDLDTLQALIRSELFAARRAFCPLADAI